MKTWKVAAAPTGGLVAITADRLIHAGERLTFYRGDDIYVVFAYRGWFYVYVE